jgi:4-amino-4-deoxy-L-arabinose transferase-like glycosyltransferase
VTVGAAGTAAGRERLALAGVLAAAFALRVGYRLRLGEADFWRNGYFFFYRMAENLVSGHGLWLAGRGWAVRQPLYPLFLALTAVGGRHYLVIVVCEALFGVATCLCGYLIGRRWFGPRAGLIAAALAAAYPYYVVHDTALQDTSMVDAGAALAVFALLRARTSASGWTWAAAGALDGLAVLIRGTLLPFALASVAWIALTGEGGLARRLARAAAVFALLAALLGAWAARNYVHVGRFTLSTETGEEFWKGNGPYTFSYYPAESIDLSFAAALRAMGPADRAALQASDEAARSDWYMARGLDYVRRHPRETLAGALRKEQTAFSWRLSPEKGAAAQALYLVSYVPILLLGLAGMVMARRGWREHSLVYLEFAGFVVVTAVFWAHTSHRVYLDVYLMVFAAAALDRALDRAPWRLSRRRA